MQEQIKGLIRHLITTFGGAIIAKGYIDEAGVELVAGAVAVVVGGVWSYFSKKK